MLATIQDRNSLFCLSISSSKRRIKLNKDVVIPVVLYGCETWSLTLRALRIFAPNLEEVTGG
jgi:hypothetical protein